MLDYLDNIFEDRSAIKIYGLFIGDFYDQEHGEHLLVYVGQTSRADPWMRIREHRQISRFGIPSPYFKDFDYWRVLVVTNASSADDIEDKIIRKMRPKYNWNMVIKRQQNL